MKQALIEDGIVREIIEVPKGVDFKDMFHPDFVAKCVECDSEVQPGWVRKGKSFAAPEPEAVPVLARIAKAEMWRRCTDDEASKLVAALQASSDRLQEIFRAIAWIDTTDPDYSALRAGVEAALGKKRAAEVLKPTE